MRWALSLKRRKSSVPLPTLLRLLYIIRRNGNFQGLV